MPLPYGAVAPSDLSYASTASTFSQNQAAQQMQSLQIIEGQKETQAQPGAAATATRFVQQSPQELGQQPQQPSAASLTFVQQPQYVAWLPVPFHIVPDASNNGNVALTNGQPNDLIAAGSTVPVPVQANSIAMPTHDNTAGVSSSVRKTPVSHAQHRPPVSLPGILSTRSHHHKRSPSKKKPPTREDMEKRVRKRKEGKANVTKSKYFDVVKENLTEAQMPQEPEEPNLQNAETTSKGKWEDSLHAFRDGIREAYAVIQLGNEDFDKSKALEIWRSLMIENAGQRKPSIKPREEEDEADGEDENEQLWEWYLGLAREKLRFQQGLEQLEKMGFGNEATTWQALHLANGDVNVAADVLSRTMQRRR